jgi:membrane-bound ClpP family serine protease
MDRYTSVIHRAAPVAWRRGFAGLVAIVAIAAAGSAQAEVAAPPDADDRDAAAKPAAAPGIAALVRVNLPLTSGADGHLRRTIERTRDRLVAAAQAAQDARRPTLVLEFVPAAATADAGAGSQFETALSLARLLTSGELNDVKTVAWIPGTIHGHGVLPALACEEIVMNAEAKLGQAGVDDVRGGAASPTVVAAYREIAATRPIPAALAEAMVDPTVEAVQVESEEGARVLRKDDLDAFRRDHEIINERTIVAPGALAEFTGREGWQFGFVKQLADDRDALAQRLAVPRDSLQENQSLDADWHAVVLDVRGEITRRSTSEFITLLGNELQRGANLVAVRIDSVGGDVAASIDLASYLASLDPNIVRTVAYVPVEARGGAALVALSCDRLVMHPQATLGAGPGAPQPPAPPRNHRVLPPPRGPVFNVPPLLAPEPPGEEFDLDIEIAKIRDSLAPKTDRSWSLLTAMIGPTAEISQYRHAGTGDVRLMSDAEAAVMPDAANWVRGEQLAAGDAPLAVTGDRAAKVGLAWHVVDSFDELERLFAAEFREVKPNWALSLIQALATPALATFLLFVGFIGLWVEIKTPGVGVGGLVATVAFILFFWSKYLDQTAGSLEILMFVCGLVLLMLEAFVFPGFGVFGLGGALMVIFSLVLASQTVVIPTTEADMAELRRSVTVVAAAGAGMIVLAFATRRYLPKAPIFNRMVLEPPPPEERITLSHREALADYSELVGRTGEATTDLRPAGKALIDGLLIDVLTDGLPIDRGTPVEVVSAHATRVVVREA